MATICRHVYGCWSEYNNLHVVRKRQEMIMYIYTGVRTNYPIQRGLLTCLLQSIKSQHKKVIEMQDEIFRPIAGYEGQYEISNLGRVKSLQRRAPRHGGVSRLIKERILRPARGTNGYLIVPLCFMGKQKTRKVHQLDADAFLEEKRDGCRMVVDHIDADVSNNSASNLQIITFRENISKGHRQNNANGIRKKTSQYTGVTWEKRNGTWRAVIYINGKHKHLGYYKDEIKAANAYQEKLKEVIDGTKK